MVTFTAQPPRLSSFNRMSDDFVLSMVVLAAIVMFCAGIASVGINMGQNGQSLPEAIYWSLPFFLAPASGVVVWVWRHMGARVVVSLGTLLTAGSVICLVGGMVSESWHDSVSDHALTLLVLCALPAVLTGLFYLVRFPKDRSGAPMESTQHNREGPVAHAGDRHPTLRAI